MVGGYGQATGVPGGGRLVGPCAFAVGRRALQASRRRFEQAGHVGDGCCVDHRKPVVWCLTPRVGPDRQGVAMFTCSYGNGESFQDVRDDDFLGATAKASLGIEFDAVGNDRNCELLDQFRGDEFQPIEQRQGLAGFHQG